MKALISLFIFFSSTLWASELHHRCPEGNWKTKLLIHQLAVGQGDAAFVRTPAGTTILIDAGNPGRGAADFLPTLVRCYQIFSLDYIVVTHPHADHFGGVAELLKSLTVKKAVYDTGHSGGTAYAKYEKSADATGKRKIPALGDGAFETGDDVKIKIIAVNGRVWGGKQVQIFQKNGKVRDKNAQSIALLFSWGNFQFYTGGDLTGHRPLDLETPVADVVGDVDVAKSNHHGSRTANSPYFLTKLKPEVVLVSVGNGEANKQYRLPNAEVMQRFSESPSISAVFQTAKGEGRAPASILNKVKNENGDIIIIADSSRYWVNGKEYKTDGK